MEWYVSKREADEVIAYLAKAELVAGGIVRGEFYKRPGRWCGYCDYLAVCIGDSKKAAETLVQIAPRP